MKFLQQVQASLERMNGYQQELAISDFIVPSKDTDRLIIKEGSEDSEVLICLREEVLDRLSERNFPEDFQLEILPDLSVVIEELSHFNTYSLSALINREISPVELEVQGEVDKFSVALEFLNHRNERVLQEKVFEVLFDQCHLGKWVEPELEQRYKDAHQIARNFCRSLLEKCEDFDQQKAAFRQFFSLSRSQKLASFL